MSATQKQIGLTALVILWASAAAPGLLAQSGTQELKMTVGKSVVIDYPSDIGRISTSNPDIVDAVPITSREILINAKANGQSTLVVWSKTGERSFFAVTVDQNLESIQKLLAEAFPNENIGIVASRDSAALNGRVSSQLVADRVMALVGPMLRTVVSNLVVTPGPVEKQIVLHVKFAELNRNEQDQWAFNLLSTGAANTPGRITTGQFSSASPTTLSGVIGGGLLGTNSTFSITDALNIFAFRPDINLAAVIRDLESHSVLQILAEPNLVTTNGKEASFLAGGEFPIPVLQGGGNAGAVTIQFREFGIRIKFTPLITGNGTIKMHIQNELSTIDLANAVVFSGFTIPALATRRTETEVELGEGQSFALSGLLDERAQQSFTKLPGLANIPILGALFKSRDRRKQKTELVVVVTPETITPLNPNDPKPYPKLAIPPIPDTQPMLHDLTKATPPAAAPAVRQ